MEIKTHRLDVVALTPEQQRTMAEDLAKLEKELGLRYFGPPLTDELKHAMLVQSERAKADPERYYWYTLWLVIRWDGRIVVGLITFTGPPDQEGGLEVGYALGHGSRRLGYITEALYYLCEWAGKQEGVKFFRAETEDDNFAAQRVLKRCEFIEAGGISTIWWQRSARILPYRQREMIRLALLDNEFLY